MIKRSLALAISLALRGLDVFNGWIRLSRGLPLPRKGIVLYYHAVKPCQRARFSRQMDEVIDRAHPFPAGRPQAMVSGRPNVAVTFDDGFGSVVENAVPELLDRSIPFTIFVPSGCLGGRPSWIRDPKHPCRDERILSAEELRTLAGHPLATVGSHTVTHSNLLELEPDAAMQEMSRSKAELESAMEVQVELFSFPHGAHSARLIRQAREAGYRRVFTIEPSTGEPTEGAFAEGRVAADPSDWPLEFRLKLAGAYRWLAGFHRFKQVCVGK